MNSLWRYLKGSFPFGLPRCLPALLATGSTVAALAQIPFPALVCQADLIVQGHVVSVAALTPAEDGGDRTRSAESVPSNIAVLSVDSVVKGTADIRSVQVEFAPDSDSPRYQVGETVVVFLNTTARRDVYATVGALQGRFAVADGMVERERIPVGKFLDRIRQTRCAASPSKRRE